MTLREVEKMMRSFLDALTPGMMAKLDPLSRIAKERRASQWDSIARNDVEAALSRYAIRPSDRLKRREALKTGASGY